MRLGDVIRIDCGLGVFSAGRISYMEVAFFVRRCNTAGMVWTGRLVNDTQDGLGRVVRTVVRYVFVHSWVLCRVDEGKKRLAGWRRG